MPMIVPRTVTPDASARVLRITWADGHESAIPYAALRDACPCAQCRDEREKGRRALRMALSVQLVGWKRIGNYALTFEWGDSHNQGIFAYDRLRALCDCATCVR